ncbi:oxygen-dependent tRNA uridine(34) hydroxylase TrhO [Gulosibacter bifidus]|uniref:tRNA uridine(34) hydroxylase n=1 Tax=Gulosibacter bifidus TaxID=272239 RepID=A0ABW5RJE5_9MICO|nr:rhodanese-related sulfurtransferase [Gulosibacter bifidus]
MATPKILLYYVFTPLADPEAIRLWQRQLCERLGLRGRILVSPHGINGTVGGDVVDCKKYVRALKEYAPFKNVDMKWSEGTGIGEDGFTLDFPRLSIKVRDEIVAFGAPDEVKVDDNGIVGGGVHLKPEEVHQLVEAKPDTVFFDGRNACEAEVGRFRGAIVPDTVTTHDFIRELESGKYDHLKSKPIITYCTGGVRCEILSALMINRGFEEVYQIDGGIVRYGETFGDDGLWEGQLTVFDGRESIPLGHNPKTIGACVECGSASSRLQNCDDTLCQQRLVVCDSCTDRHSKCARHPLEAAA